jgi:predicted nucleic acid-binding protein
MRFWDSSAIVPLVVTQSFSATTDAWLGEDRNVVLWTLTPVEVVSALRRLTRDGLLEQEVALRAETELDELMVASHHVTDVESVKQQARRLLRLHPLRAGDAMQLAAALEWTTGRPAGKVLHTFDQRLAHAARLEGFDVVSD